MGGRSSQPVPTEGPTDGTEEEGGGGQDEGFFTLSESLQQDMALEFQNEQVVKMFGKQMEKIGERKAAAYKEHLEQRATLERKLQEYRQQNETVQNQLNERIEGMEDKFTDMANVVEYDMNRLAKQYLKSSLTEKNILSIPCFVEQTEIVTCLNNKSKSEESKNDPFACDVFIKALNDCTHRTITSKNGEKAQ
mmetsp:Transcript_14799/g.41239  ORF Transcript_14799/g.41239 Transcript_14799/m.41239 type:complete len:193 (-) Transcript_14799:4101-4679(-)